MVVDFGHSRRESVVDERAMGLGWGVRGEDVSHLVLGVLLLELEMPSLVFQRDDD